MSAASKREKLLEQILNEHSYFLKPPSKPKQVKDATITNLHDLQNEMNNKIGELDSLIDDLRVIKDKCLSNLLEFSYSQEIQTIVSQAHLDREFARTIQDALHSTSSKPNNELLNVISVNPDDSIAIIASSDESEKEIIGGGRSRSPSIEMRLHYSGTSGSETDNAKTTQHQRKLRQLSTKSGKIKKKKRKRRITPFRCRVCRRSFSSSRDLGNHMRIHETFEEFNCPFCGKVYLTQTFLEIHMHHQHTPICLEAPDAECVWISSG